MAEPLKDTLYRREFFDDLAAVCAGLYPAFDRQALLARVFDDAWEARALKERMRHLTVVLRDLLPPDYRAALRILEQAAPHVPGGFLLMSFPDFVELYGLDDWEASIPALALFTRYASSEFAVRPFILRDPPRMMAQMLDWSRDDNEHIRRLSSEGCRPRLPWALALPMFKRDPSPILPVLENLKDDPSEYVRRSVANNLNDIAKDNPQVTVDLLRRWQDGAGETRQWIIRRALRSLVKAGHDEALALLGFDGGANVAVHNLTLSADRVRLGDRLDFSFEVESRDDAPHNLVVDYVVHFQKANGTLSPKVFKLAQRQIQPGERLRFEKRHSFAPISTRRYYPGEHALSVKINGQDYGDERFTLEL